MRFGEKVRCVSGFLAVLALSACPFISDAHSLWLNFTNYMPALSESGQMKTKLYIGWGHHFPVDSYSKAEEFEKITLRDPAGIEKDVTLETEGFSAASLTLNRPGLYTAAVTRKAAPNTKYEENGKTIAVKGDKVGKENIVSSVYSQQFAKSVICAGGSFTGDITHEFGQKLEMIPMIDPYEITNNCGGIMKVKVLFDGKPLPFLKVWGMYEGYSSDDSASVMASTNRDGVAEFRIDHWGTWLFRTRYDRTAQGEMAKRVNDEHYFSALTFAVP